MPKSLDLNSDLNLKCFSLFEMVTFRKNVMIIYANYAHVGIIYAGNKEDSVTANRENVIKIKQKHPHAAYLPVPIAKPISLCVLSAKERIQKTQLLVVPGSCHSTRCETRENFFSANSIAEFYFTPFTQP